MLRLRLLRLKEGAKAETKQNKGNPSLIHIPNQMYLPKHIPMFHPNALSCTQLPSDQPEAELLWSKRVEPLRGSKRLLDTFPSLGPTGRSGNVYDADVYNDRVPPIPPPIFHRRQPHPDADLLYDDSVYQVYFPPKTVTYVFRPPPPHSKQLPFYYVCLMNLHERIYRQSPIFLLF